MRRETRLSKRGLQKQMLNLFSSRSKDRLHSEEIEELKKRVADLQKDNENLTSALRKTQDILASVSKSQSEFIMEFNRVLLPVLRAAKESQGLIDENGNWN
jgi:CRISPR/Cas system-associated endonuclease Cas3-HD